MHSQKKKDVEYIKTILDRVPHLGSSKLAITMIGNAITTNASWDEIENIAYKLSDTKAISDLKKSAKYDIDGHGHSFDALGKLKEKADEKDKYYVYKMNNRSMNGQASYVFKSSRIKAECALQMDKESDGPLAQEFCYFDAMHSRFRGFKTITLWVLHPLIRRMLKIACMEVEKESTKNLVLFWKTLNEMLSEVKGDPSYKFNPAGWVCDEHGANWNSIKEVFGDTAQAVSCEFHFKQCRRRQAQKIADNNDKEKFDKLTDTMLCCSTTQKYDSVLQKLHIMANRYTFLSTWLAWWHARRYHAFTAFKRFDNAPAANLSEIGHAKMKFSSQTNMMLVDTARADIAETLRQSIEIQTFKKGTGRALGREPNAAEKRRRITQAQNKRARDYADELFDESNLAIQENDGHSNNFIPSKSSRHRPPKPKQARVVEQKIKMRHLHTNQYNRIIPLA